MRTLLRYALKGGRSCLFLLLSAALTLGALARPAEAGHIPSVNYDTIAPPLAEIIEGPWTTRFISGPVSGSLDLGVDLRGTVYYDEATAIFTYEFLVNPNGLENISHFTTGPEVSGFTGVAGYSFSQAQTAGALEYYQPFFPPGAPPLNLSNAFIITLDEYGIDWAVNREHAFYGRKLWKETAGITFFYQSTNAPGEGPYHMMSSHVGSTTNFSPIPEPAGIFLLATGFAGLLRVGRKRRKH